MNSLPYLPYLQYVHYLPYPSSMNTPEIQKQCEAFLKSIGIPGFIVIGLQTGPDNTEVVYSLNNMPLKDAVKGISHTLNDLISKI